MDGSTAATPRIDSKREPDPQLLLPEALRGDWVVLPKRSAYWLFSAGAILGTGLGLTVAGLGPLPTGLRWGLGAAVLLVMAGAHFLLKGHEERKLRELGPYLSAGPRGGP